MAHFKALEEEQEKAQADQTKEIQKLQQRIVQLESVNSPAQKDGQKPETGDNKTNKDDHDLDDEEVKANSGNELRGNTDKLPVCKR